MGWAHTTQRSRDEHGAVAVLLAVCMTVVIAAAAVVIDAGQVWATRRQAITATDAAALAAAQDFAQWQDGCTSGVAATYLAANTSVLSLDSCTSTGAGTQGTVTVDASGRVDHALGAVVGRDHTEVTSSSTAYFGPATALRGLRPFSLCSQSDAFGAWQASGHSLTTVFRIYYTRDNPTQCGGVVPGNWGLMDFNGGANTLDELRSWIRGGFPESVSVPGWFEGDPGAFSNAMDLDAVLGQEIHIPVFDDATGVGDGAEFHLEGFVSVIIHGFKDNGPESGRYLDIQFTTAVASGSCCGTGALDAGLFGIGLCKVDGRGTCPT